MANHSHKKKASSLLTLLGSLLLLTITSPHSLINPQVGMQLGIGCMNFLCCGNMHQFLRQAREVLMSYNYTTCSAINSGMCSKSVTSLKRQSHCLCRWIVKIWPNWPEMLEQIPYYYRNRYNLHLQLKLTVLFLDFYILFQNFGPVLRKHILHRFIFRVLLMGIYVKSFLHLPVKVFCYFCLVIFPHYDP